MFAGMALAASMVASQFGESRVELKHVAASFMTQMLVGKDDASGWLPAGSPVQVAPDMVTNTIRLRGPRADREAALEFIRVADVEPYRARVNAQVWMENPHRELTSIETVVSNSLWSIEDETAGLDLDLRVTLSRLGAIEVRMFQWMQQGLNQEMKRIQTQSLRVLPADEMLLLGIESNPLNLGPTWSVVVPLAPMDLSKPEGRLAFDAAMRQHRWGGDPGRPHAARAVVRFETLNPPLQIHRASGTPVRLRDR